MLQPANVHQAEQKRHHAKHQADALTAQTELFTEERQDGHEHGDGGGDAREKQ